MVEITYPSAVFCRSLLGVVCPLEEQLRAVSWSAVIADVGSSYGHQTGTEVKVAKLTAEKIQLYTVLFFSLKMVIPTPLSKKYG